MCVINSLNKRLLKNVWELQTLIKIQIPFEISFVFTRNFFNAKKFFERLFEKTQNKKIYIWWKMEGKKLYFLNCTILQRLKSSQLPKYFTNVVKSQVKNNICVISFCMITNIENFIIVLCVHYFFFRYSFYLWFFCIFRYWVTN
jgi:hypothetical protein